MPRLIDADTFRDEWLENGENEYVYDTNAVLDSIDRQPTIDAEPVRHGRWVRKTGNGYYWYECSECGAKPLKNSYKDDCFSDYCPHCGAKMDGGAEK